MSGPRSERGDVSNNPIVRKQPPGFNKDMLKPLIFGNYQPHFKFFTAVVCIGLWLAIALVHD